MSDPIDHHDRALACLREAEDRNQPLLEREQAARLARAHAAIHAAFNPMFEMALESTDHEGLPLSSEWRVHTIGSDDVTIVAGKLEAFEEAARINAVIVEQIRRAASWGDVNVELMPMVWALPVAPNLS